MKVRCLILLLLLVSPAVLHSQDTLPPVVVSSTRLRDVEQPITQVPGKVIVITADEIKTLGAKTIQEALQYQTGVVLYDQVGNDFQSTVDMRGFNGQPVTTITLAGTWVGGCSTPRSRVDDTTTGGNASWQ